MKTKLYLCLLGALCLFTACKKDEQSKTSTTTTTTTAPLVKDSIFFTINGKNYFANTVFNGSQVVSSANNVETFVNQQYLFSDSKDTVLAINNFLLSYNSDATTNAAPTIQFSFFKKFNIAEFHQKGILFSFLPMADQATMYAPGTYIFATDFMRRSNTSGVAIGISGVGATYSTKLLGQPSAITQSLENNSSFVVTSLTKVKNTDTDDSSYAQYILTGTFTATVFDANEQPMALTNGYIKIHVATFN
jgi:hypothetical protein